MSQPRPARVWRDSEQPIVALVERTTTPCTSPFCVLAQCAGRPDLFCYHGGCPPAGSDADAQCVCADPYTGANCGQVMCSHSAVTCYNGGECKDGQSCTCPPGYGGVDCRGRKRIPSWRKSIDHACFLSHSSLRCTFLLPWSAVCPRWQQWRDEMSVCWKLYTRRLFRR